MNKYEKLISITVMENGIEIVLEINYKELRIVYEIRNGLRAAGIAERLKLQPQTVYNTTYDLRSRFNAETNTVLAKKFDHVDFEELLGMK